MWCKFVLYKYSHLYLQVRSHSPTSEPYQMLTEQLHSDNSPAPKIQTFSTWVPLLSPLPPRLSSSTSQLSNSKTSVPSHHSWHLAGPSLSCMTGAAHLLLAHLLLLWGEGGESSYILCSHRSPSNPSSSMSHLKHLKGWLATALGVSSKQPSLPQLCPPPICILLHCFGQTELFHVLWMHHALSHLLAWAHVILSAWKTLFLPLHLADPHSTLTGMLGVCMFCCWTWAGSPLITSLSLLLTSTVIGLIV